MYSDSSCRRHAGAASLLRSALLGGMIGMAPSVGAAGSESQSGDELDALFANQPKASAQGSADEPPGSSEQGSSESDARSAAATPVITLEEEEVPRAAPAPPPRQIEEIVVTATKRASSTRDLPLSVDAFSGDELQASGADSLDEFLRYSPGVTVNQGLDQDSVFVTIRGITANSQGGFFNRPTGLFYDDVTLVNPSIRGTEPNMDPFDMTAVEVLKGPQGTLFGGSALAGAVRYVPQSPRLGEEGPSGQFVAGLSTLAHSDGLAHSLGLAANLPLTDNGALRLVGSRRRHPGIVDDSHSGERDIDSGGSDQYRMIGRWQWQAIDLELSYLRREAFQDDGSRSDQIDVRRVDGRRWPDTSRSVVEIPRLEVSWGFEAAELVLSASRLSKRGLLDFDQTRTLGIQDTTAVAHQLVQPDVTQPAGELRLVSSRATQGPAGWQWLLGDWDYTLGLFWQESDQVLDAPIFLRPAGSVDSPLPPLLPGTEATDAEEFILGIFLDAVATEKALYFDTVRHLGAFDIGIGGRFFRQVTRGGSLTTNPGQDVDSGRAVLEERGVNPKFSLSWQATDQLKAYAAATRGFRYGGINPVIDPTVPLTFKSDRLWNYEIGLRSEWFDRRLQADLTAFYVDWKDVQIEQVSTGLLSWSANVGAVRSQGVEFATRMLLPWDLSLDANAAYVDSRTTVQFESVDGMVPPGTRMPATPYLTGSLSLGHARDFGPWQLTSGLAYSWSGRYTNNIVATYELPVQRLLNLSVGVSRPDLAWQPSLGLNVNNLFDEQDLVSVQTNIGTGVETIRTWFNRPRTVLLNLGLRF